MKRSYFSRSGQSLIEVMVAITMLTVSFLGISVLLSRSLALNRVTANDVTAAYLASEGIEITKNLIDHDVYAGLAHKGTGWGTCFAGRGTPDFELDYETTDCGSLAAYDSSKPLLYDPPTHLYGYEAGVATIFARDIRVSRNPAWPGDPNDDEITINVLVSWSGLDGAPDRINLEDRFYNWYSTSTPQ